MRQARLFIEGDVTPGKLISIGAERAHYVSRVLRARTGDALRLFNGDGSEWSATIEAISRHEVRINPQSRHDQDLQSPLQLHLGIGLSRGERMDWLIQKSTELGVSAITPLQLKRCTVKREGARADTRLRHWRQVAISACEQCGRCRLPEINPPTSLDAWISASTARLRLVLTPTPETVTKPDFAQRPDSIDLLIGPEGGLDSSELSTACASGFQRWRLGPRILRTETAPLVALAILQYQLGDL